MLARRGGTGKEGVPRTRNTAVTFGSWIDLDPTNDQFVDDRYLTVAWGRDYSDVPPLKGVVFTESESHELTVSVDVTPVPDGDPVLTA